MREMLDGENKVRKAVGCDEQRINVMRRMQLDARSYAVGCKDGNAR